MGAVTGAPSERRGGRGPGRAGPSMASKSSLPVRRECNVPGKHLWEVWKTPFLIDERYTPIKAIGKGAYGVVCSARDAVTGNKVAVKKIGKVFETLHDARRALREMLLLRHLRHDNIIAILDIMRPASPDTFEDLYLVYDLMDTDLDQIIRSSQPLTDDHFQFFIYQACAQCQLNYASHP